MSQENVDVKSDPGQHPDLPAAQSGGPDRSRRLRLWVNWGLAVLTAIAAGAAMTVALGAVMSTAACSDKACPNLGPRGISFDTLYYGAPVIAAVTILLSFFTAKRRWGFVVPVTALALLIADMTVLVVTVAQ
jgi:hypothetical protein